MKLKQTASVVIFAAAIGLSGTAGAWNWHSGDGNSNMKPFPGSPMGNGAPFGEHGPIFGSMPFNRWNNPMRGGPWDQNPFPMGGMFGEYGPHGRGAPPWGRPSDWFTPWDPKEGFGNWWDDSINAPHRFGRYPPGWEAPTVDFPNPVDVHDEFDRAYREWEGM